MKSVLIPTDFTSESLQLVEYAFLNFPDENLEIILLAGCKLPETRWGVTHFSPEEFIYKKMDDPFVQGKRRLIKEHKRQLEKIRFELFSGKNAFAFQNFLLKLEVDTAIVPNTNYLCNTDKRWFDTTDYLRNNVTNIIQVPVETKREINSSRGTHLSFINLFDF